MKIKLIILLLINNLAFSYLRIYQYYPDKVENFRAEYFVYNLIKTRNIHKNLVFIYAPWSYLYNNLKDRRLPNIKNALHIRVKDAFTVCSHDYYEELIPFFKQLGIKVLFVSGANTRKYKDIEIVSTAYVARNVVKPSKNKDIFYSFIGACTHDIRRQIFNMKHPTSSVVIERDTFHFNKNNDQKLLKKYEAEYANVLGRTRFSLCPRGFGAGSYRFWESLHAGAIPVLIADDHLLPPGYNWNKCVIKVKESDVNNIAEILSKITPAQESYMRRNCYQAYKLYSGNNFDRVIRLYYNI